jgi:hypothetical protein
MSSSFPIKQRKASSGVAGPEPNNHMAVIPVMKPTSIISEKKAAIVIWISAAIFTVGAMIFGH